MKKWTFKLNSNIEEASKNMKSALATVNGLVFNMSHYKNNSITFKLRKRISYPFYLFFLNSIVLNGKLSKTDIENETAIEISFSQHILWKLILFLDLFLGLSILIALIFTETSSDYMFLIGITILAIGIILWVTVYQKYERNIQEYKIMISNLLDL